MQKGVANRSAATTSYLVVASMNLVGGRLEAPVCRPAKPQQLDTLRLHDEPNCRALEALMVA